MQNMSSSIRLRRGFTLVEIMVVVVIIGILAAIGVPAYSKMRDTARKQAVTQNLRAIVTAAQAYFADHMSDANIPTSVTYNTLKTDNYIPGTFKPVGGESYDSITIQQNPSGPTEISVNVPQISSGTKDVKYSYQ